MSQNWHTTPQPFTRRSFLSLAEFSRASPPGINPAVMLCTSLTQSMNSGTSPSWRGTDLCRALGQSVQGSHTQVHSILNQVLYFSLTENPYSVRKRHSATLMSQKLVIFGGRKTATYLNDLHILDLGRILILQMH